MERNTLKIKANTDNVVKFLYDTPSVSGSYKPTTVDDRTKDIHRQVCLKLAVQSMGVCSSMEEEFNYGEVKDRMEGLLNILDGKKIPEKKEDLPF